MAELVSMGTFSGEEWRPVVGFEGNYEVSNFGRVRTVAQLLPQHNLHSGEYPKVSLTVGRRRDKGIRRHQYEVHALVAAAFIGARPSGCVVDHINANKKDNRVTNLEYVTRSENAKRAWKLSLLAKPPHFYGQLHWKSTVSNRTRRAIVRRKMRGERTCDVARRYRLNQGTVYSIFKSSKKAMQEWGING